MLIVKLWVVSADLMGVSSVPARRTVSAVPPVQRAPAGAPSVSKAESGLLTSARWEALEALTRVGTWAVDLRTGWTVWSPMMRQLCGVSPQAPIPDLAGYLALVEAADRERVGRDLGWLFDNGTPLDSEHRLTADGQTRVLRARGQLDLDRAGRPLRAWGATQDVTSLRSAQQALAAERDGSRALLAALSDGYVYTVDGVICDVNDVFCTLTGFSRQELLGRSRPYPFWPAEGVDAAGFHSRLVDDGGEIELELCRKDGSCLYVAVKARQVNPTDPEPSGAGAVAGRPAVLGDPAGNRRAGRQASFVSVMRDVTLARAQQVELLETQRMLVDAQHQAQLGSWTMDFATAKLTFSAQMRTLCGLPADAPTPTVEQFLALVPPEDLPEFRRLFVQALQTGGIHHVQHRLRRADGSVRHIYGTASIELDAATGRPTRMRGSAQDVTVRVAREQALAASEEQFRLTQAHSPIGLALVGLDGRWLQVNEAVARITGYSTVELLTKTFQDVTHPDDLDADLDLVNELIAGTRDSYQLDKRYRHAAGHDVWVSLHVAVVRAHDRTPLHFVSQIVDISHRQAHAEALEAQAGTDPLTGLANRRTWEKTLAELFHQVTDGAATMSLAILDLDHFKAYNDTHGHPAGDTLLAEVAEAWTTQLATDCPRALIARLGGEEFGLALPDVDAPAARTLLLQLLSLTPHGQTTSAGITLATADDDLGSLVTRADAALYAAKHRGRNRCELLLAG